jgi:hypothetical protein
MESSQALGSIASLFLRFPGDTLKTVCARIVLRNGKLRRLSSPLSGTRLWFGGRLQNLPDGHLPHAVK